MKSCPACKRTYADETLAFCLVDGSILSAPFDPRETLRVPAPRDTEPARTEILNPPPGPSDFRPPALSTIQASPLLTPAMQPAPLKESPGGKHRMAIGIGISLVIVFAAGAILSFIWFGRERPAESQAEARTPNANALPTALPTATPTATRETVGWGQRNDRASLTGENLTYYPGTTPEQCQADCDKNARCRGYTFIRPGAYNPTDPAMCYLASVVREMVSHECCISAVKR